MNKLLTTDPKLSDHKRFKKRLLAPFHRLRDKGMVTSSWELQRLPEVVWINELLASLGHDITLRILCACFRVARHNATPSQVVCPPLASYWAKHATKELKQSLIDALKSEHLIADVGRGLRTFLTLYPEYPMAFLIQPSKSVLLESELGLFKERLKGLLDRLDVPATRVNALIVEAELASGNMRVSPEIKLPDIRLVFRDDADVNSDDFRSAGGFARSSTMNLFAYFGHQSALTAGEYFWNRGLELEDCS